MSRRAFVVGAAAVAGASAASKHPPIGLELYSVRNELKQDLMGTVRAVAKMGYDNVEFYSPYFEWTPEYAKEVRKMLDDSGIVCLSTHNSPRSISDGVSKAIDLNGIIGSKSIIVASTGRLEGLDGWKKFADLLNSGADKLKGAGMRTGFHNHKLEFVPLEGKRPMEVIAANTSKDVILQLDVGSCMEAGSDPVKWINDNPGRIRSIHCKDWDPAEGKGFRVQLGEGAAPWKKIIEAAEKKGGVENYLVEQEGADLPPMETAQRCLTNFKKLLAS